MELDLESLGEKDKRAIIRELVEHVVKSDSEVKEKETRGGRQTDLKLYICDNKGFNFGSLETTIQKLAKSSDTSKKVKSFIGSHTISEDPLRDDVSLVTITTPDVGRTDEFVFVESDEYVWVLTTERKEWTKRTVEKLVAYLPSLERLYLSSEDLEELILELKKAHVSGFTAKYHAPYRDRDATLRFHGAEPEDLDTAKEAFDATPTRLEFDQANSPEVAIQGAETNNGEIKLESVRSGSQPAAVETLLGLSEDYQQRDRENFEVEEKPTRHKLDSGIGIDGFTAIELKNPDRVTVSTEVLAEELKDHVFSSHQYEYGMWGEETFFVHDKDHEEVFEVALEPPNIILYPRETTTSLSLRSFCRDIFDDFDSTYSLEKVETKLSG